jgi:hypothetical protein
MNENTDIKQSEKINNLDNKVLYMGKEFGKLENAVNSGFEKLEKKIDNLDSKYASKRTEVLVDRLGWLIIVGVIGSVLSLILY